MNFTTEPKAFARIVTQGQARPGWGPQILRLGVTLALMLACVATAQSFRVLKKFTGFTGGDGYGLNGLALAGDTLYGTAQNGGAWGCGIVFKLRTDGSGYAVLKDFSPWDGQSPYTGLVLAGSTLYGTTQAGGWGDGVIFKLNTDGSGYAVLKNLTWEDGFDPRGGLVPAGNTLYGTTYSGGTSGYGVVFLMNTDGSGYTVLKNFTGDDGAHPCASLALAGTALYGTTPVGGDYDDGVAFKLNTDGTGYTVLKSFSGHDDGAYPCAGLVLAGSTLYGTTKWGGWYDEGVVFQVNTDGSGYAVLKNFFGFDGGRPLAAVALSGGTLYGTTSAGGPGTGAGVVFKLNTNGLGYGVIKSFTGSDGYAPQADLVMAGSTLYGTTFNGGDSAVSGGVVFSGTCLSITTPPSSQTAEIGTSVRFSVEAESFTPEPAYQWWFGGTRALAGATNAILDLTNVQPARAGAYTVVVTNLAEGAVTSAAALLSVIPRVDRRVLPAVCLTGQAGSRVHLEYADSLPAVGTQWLYFTNATLGTGPQFCCDLSQPLPGQRFFRAWQTGWSKPALDMSLATEIPLTGQVGSSVRIDYINAIGPTNAWVTLDTVRLTATTALYFDVTAFRQPTRLYRLVPVP